jgi:hypothetical protein
MIGWFDAHIIGVASKATAIVLSANARGIQSLASRHLLHQLRLVSPGTTPTEQPVIHNVESLAFITAILLS